MHIILGEQNGQAVSDKYVVLELDTFRVTDEGQEVPAFCLVENVPVHELSEVEQFRDLHAQMIKNYRLGNWKFCQDALQHLKGRWNGEVDSFYHALNTRITNLCDQKQDVSSWNPVIKI